MLYNKIWFPCHETINWFQCHKTIKLVPLLYNNKFVSMSKYIKQMDINSAVSNKHSGNLHQMYTCMNALDDLIEAL